MSTAINAFRVTGIWPVDSNTFNEHDFLASAATDIDLGDTNSTNDQQNITDMNTIQLEVPDPGQKESITTDISTNQNSPGCSYWQNIGEKVFPMSSPEDIQPIPKSSKTTARCSKRRGKTVILTDSPYKNELLAANANSKPQTTKCSLFGNKNKTKKIRKVKTKEPVSSDVDASCLYCVLKRVIELSDELRIFLREIKPDLSAPLSNEKWMCLASYLADVFDKVNELNVSLQGQSTNILVLTSKLQAFNKKLSSWLNAFNNGDTSIFTSLHDFLTVNELSLTTSVASVITEHMSSMLQFLSKYFPNLNINNEYNWIKTPFSTSLKYDHIPWAIKEQLIEIREDSTLESEFHEKELSEFWLRRQQEYPLISKAALLILIPFASTYLCETAFSQL
ncbi:hypothetical protein QTP88_010089 [Uroleucon formosanum]